MNRTPKALAVRAVNRIGTLSGSRIARGLYGTMGLKVAALVLGLFLNVLLARSLQPQGFGLYTFVFTVVTLASMPLRSGFGQLLVRELAVYEQRREWGSFRGLLGTANVASAALALVAIVVIGAMTWLGWLQGPAALWIWAAVLIPLYSLGGLRGAALRGLRKPVLGLLPEYLLRPAILVGLLLAATTFWSLDPTRAMALHAIAMAGAFLIGAWLLWRALPADVKQAQPTHHYRAWFAAVLPFTLLAGMQVIQGSLDVLMLGAFSGTVEVGIFRAGEQFAGLVGLPLFAVNMVLAPQVARAYAANDRPRMQLLATWAARASTGLAVPLTLAFCLAGGWVLGMAYGAEYQPAWPVLAVLSISAMICAACGPVGILLNMAGFEKESVKAVSLALLLNAVLNLLLVPRFGALGAAIATGTATVAWNIVLVWRLRILLRIKATVFSTTRVM